MREAAEDNCWKKTMVQVTVNNDNKTGDTE